MTLRANQAFTSAFVCNRATIHHMTGGLRGPIETAKIHGRYTTFVEKKIPRIGLGSVQGRPRERATDHLGLYSAPATGSPSVTRALIASTKLPG